jgi:ubiquinol-cytochrome c reductase cytochrome b subunit
MVRLLNKNLISIVAGHGVSYPTPSNLNYFWGFGSVAGLLLVWQVLSGVLLAMHYSPEVGLAFYSIEHIMRDVPSGWLIRYCHSGGASMFFIFTYIHIGRGLYFRSYRKVKLWYSGLTVFLLMMATAFLGYVLPWGQMSLWGATVITNLFGAIPLIGKDLVIWLWGGFSVDNPTLKRFFVLHFMIPLVLIALSGVHLVLLHENGSTNPLGICSKVDTVRFYPKFITKDVFGFITFVGLLVIFTVFWYPNDLGHPDNYIKADALITPKHIVPEWYFLPFYAILRSIPDKLGGVVAMLSSIVILFLMPYVGKFNSKSSKFSKASQFFFWVFVFNLVLLGWLGACVVEPPFILFSQLATIYYFAYFLLILPLLSFIEKRVYL